MRLVTSVAKPVEASRRWIASSSAIFVALGGAVFGGVVLFFDHGSWPHDNLVFSHHGSFLLWAFLILAQTGIWPVAVGWIWPDLRELAPNFGKSRREIMESLFALGVATWAGILLATFLA